MSQIYILLSKPGVDLYAVDGAPFNERYHIDEVSDDQIREIFGNEDHRVLILGKVVFDRVTQLIHFPIRKAKFTQLFGLSAITLASGCKVKLQEDWNKFNCESIFHESWIKSICPDRPKVEMIFEKYDSVARNKMHYLTNLPKGSDLGFDYETSGLPKNEVEEANFKFYQLQGRNCEFKSYSGKTFQITGFSICHHDYDTNEDESYYYAVKSILDNDPDNAKLFWDDFYKFMEEHDSDCWAFNSHFETKVTYIFLHHFFTINDAAIVNYIEGRNMFYQSLKVTVERIEHIRSWDDAFDELINKLNYLLSDAFQVDWENGTVVQDGIKYVWYDAPYFTEIFSPYGEDMVAEAKELAKDSFMNPLLCIPPKILGRYCNIDSYSTVQLIVYCRSKYSKECIETFSANIRYSTYLDISGNFIDSNEFRRQRSVANKASNWGMLLLWQQLTEIDIKQFAGNKSFDFITGKPYADILRWCQANGVKYLSDSKAMLRSMLEKCINWDNEDQVDENLLHEAFPWDYTYEAIRNAIHDWGGLGYLFSRKNGKFYSGNAWIVREYGAPSEEDINLLNDAIYFSSLIRRQEWLWYLTNKIPYWNSDVPEYITLNAANTSIVSNFVSTDGKKWYESPEFDEYAKLNKLQTTKDDPHYFISGWLNVGAPSGMMRATSQMYFNTDGWISTLIPGFITYDNYLYGTNWCDKFLKTHFEKYDIWNTIKDWTLDTVYRLFIAPDGSIEDCTPVINGLYKEMGEWKDTPAGRILISRGVNEEPEDTRRISDHPEFLGQPMLETQWDESSWGGKNYIGYRYLYVNKFISKEMFIEFYNHWQHRRLAGYKDFMECVMMSIGTMESYTLYAPWDWNSINSTKLHATGTKLDEIRPIIGLYTWRKFRKILSTYLKNLLIEGGNFTKPEYTEESSGLVISEYTIPDWAPNWDLWRGHPRWNCMAVHTKRWCLAGDTPILVMGLHGPESVPIKDLKNMVGRYVYAFDTKSNRWVLSQITNWWLSGRDQKVYKLVFTNGLEVKCTGTHEFLSRNGRYIRADELTVNDDIQCIDGSFTKLRYIILESKTDVYDIEVDTYHNFTIGTIESNVVCHNSSGFHTLFHDSDTKKVVSVPKNKLLFYLDISQAEPRVLAYKTKDPLMMGWYEAGHDVYIELAKLFNPEVVTNTYMTDDQKRARLKELRGLYKVLVLAIMYGMGIGSLSLMVGKPKNEAKRLRDEFMDAMPNVEKFVTEHMEFPDDEHPYVKTILGDRLDLYDWDKGYRWARQGINFCIQSFASLSLIQGFENMVRTAMKDGLTFSPIGTVHDSSQMIMDPHFIYNCQAHFDLNYTEYIYKIHGVKYKGDIEIGPNYYDLSVLTIVNEDTIQLEGSADSINGILDHMRNAGINDFKLNIDEKSIIPDYFSSVPKQVVRTMGGGAMPDKSKYKVQITFGPDVINFHKDLVTGDISSIKGVAKDDILSMDISEFREEDRSDSGSSTTES